MQKAEKGAQGQSVHYSMTHGFFCGMGGLAFDDSNNTDRVFPVGIDRLTLSPRFIVWCLEHDYADIIPQIAESEIKDKSKADDLVKGFACIQALWFCLQFCTRLAQKLPVSLLELNTFAHSICALLIYVLWWKKPLDIDESMIIPTDRSAKVLSLAAWAASKTRHALYQWCTDISGFFDELFSKQPTQPWVSVNYLADENFITGGQDPSRPWDGDHIRIKHPSAQRLSSPMKSAAMDPQPSFRGLENIDGDYEYSSCSPLILYLPFGSSIPGTEFRVRIRSLEVDEPMLRRFEARFLLKDTLYEPWHCPLKSEISNAAWHPKVANLKKLKGGNIDQYIGLSVTGLLYGALHALAFGQPLGSRAETLLWQISCLTIASFGIVWFLLCESSIILDELSAKKLLKNRLLQLVIFVLFPAGLAIIPLYVVSRVFLVVEIFLSLPYVDPGVYSTPNWSLYFPHIG